MKKKTRKIILGIIIILALCLFGSVYLFRYSIIELANYVFFDEYVLEELTMEQKLEDFEQLHTTIVESVPFLDEVEKWYGTDFEERKEYYISEIKKTEDNFEFYCVMAAMMGDVASFHTDLCDPIYWNVRNLACYNNDKTIRALGMKSKIDAWEEVIKDKVLAYESINMLNVRYVDGKYYVENNSLSESFGEMEDFELISVAGVPAEDFIANSLSIFRKYYDSEYNKVYRRRFTFNDSIGEKVEMVWYDGEEYIIKELFWDRGVEYVSNIGYLYSDKYMRKLYEPNVTMYRDDINKLEYIKINNFANDQGEEVKEYLENVHYAKIVIDLRNNYGGYESFFKKYLYPALYSEDIEYSYQCKVPDTETNRFMIDDWLFRFGASGEKIGSDYVYTLDYRYEGEQVEEKQVFYLVGPGTGSAADKCINVVKEYNLGTVVGENTAGEGLGHSYICDGLKNSHLIFAYFPAIPVGENLANSCVGTVPDVYIRQSKEEFDLAQQYEKDGTLYEYEKRLEYDALLKWVINQE